MLKDLPQDRKSLEAIPRSLILERDQQKQRAEQERKRASELHLENLRLHRSGKAQEMVLRAA